jgi:2-(1,2-epoxy-1,2-dihydrophenyl)acetyl-CoA isomerase
VISLSIVNKVAEIVLDAPHKLNSLDEQALADLAHAYDDAADAADAAAAAARGEVLALLLRGEARALLLRGEGPAFCAGRDIQTSRRRVTTPKPIWRDWCSRC